MHDDLTKALLERADANLLPDPPNLETPQWGKRQPPVTKRFGYTGGDFTSGLMNDKPIEYA
jgi:hypothetical protein